MFDYSTADATWLFSNRKPDGVSLHFINLPERQNVDDHFFIEKKKHAKIPNHAGFNRKDNPGINLNLCHKLSDNTKEVV